MVALEEKSGDHQSHSDTSSGDYECLYKFCASPSCIYFDIALDGLKLWPVDCARWKVRELPKSVRFILWEPWMFVHTLLISVTLSHTYRLFIRTKKRDFMPCLLMSQGYAAQILQNVSDGNSQWCNNIMNAQNAPILAYQHWLAWTFYESRAKGAAQTQKYWLPSYRCKKRLKMYLMWLNVSKECRAL